MTTSITKPIHIMPYSLMVGQRQLKLALELAYIAPRIGGVLLSGHRGTGKSTVVRAFVKMLYDKLPTTLPINATEDRVVGGWNIDELLKRNLEPQPGLLEEANKSLLYIDEVNLLDDHIVNIILDVTSTGVLNIEREGKHDEQEIQFTLVGTMNPSEGGLRPQLLDRFGLMVDVTAEQDEAIRVEILWAVLDYDAALALENGGQMGEPLNRLNAARASDLRRRKELQRALKRFQKVRLPHDMAELCVQIGKMFQVEGHRGDYVMALAARANAALRKANEVTIDDIAEVAPLALQHRRPGVLQSGNAIWSDQDTQMIMELAMSKRR